MKDSNNVVSLSGLQREARKSSESAMNLPEVVVSLRDKARALLAEQAKQVFAKVDDSLFAMAEKAHGQDEQDGLFQALRLLRVERRNVMERFGGAIDRAFQLKEPASDDTDPYAAENLSLVHNDELEQLVAVDTMVASARRDFSEPLTEISLRLNTLLSVKVYDKNNPLGPDAICDAFLEAARPLDLHIRARLTLLKKFEQQVMLNLGSFYDQCNEFFVERGVLPSLKQQRRAARQQRQTPRPQTGGSGSIGSGQVADGSVMQPATGVPQGAAVGGVGHGLVPLSAGVAPMPAQDLLSHLGELQALAPQEYFDDGTQLLNVNSLLQQRLVEARQSASLAKVDSDIIKLVEMLFSFILEDRNLAEPIKMQLGRMQLPLLKVAIADKSFFSKGGHPARKLLNELADACTGWQAKENYESDPLFKKVSEVVAEVLAQFDQDIHIFSTLLESFRGFIERERKRAQKLEQRIVDEADGRAKTQAARARVAAVMEALSAERDMPPVVSEWLEKVWSNMLFLTCIKDGTESDAWSRDVRTARDLVWSVHAPMPDSRQQLLGLLPVLQERLRAGVEAVSLNSFDARRMFTGLKEVYRERFALAQKVIDERNREARDAVREEARRELEAEAEEARSEQVELEPEAESQPPQEAVVELPQMEELEQVVAEADVRVADESADVLPESDSHWQQTFRLAQGSWFELKRDGEEQFRCRLAAVIKDIDQFIFVNRNGAKVAEFTRLELAHALRQAELMPLDDGMLFERALQSVIGTVRKSRGEMS